MQRDNEEVMMEEKIIYRRYILNYDYTLTLYKFYLLWFCYMIKKSREIK